CAGTGTWFAYW
nr:immunoglobulin heavy chain junction region [Mus musculus]